jgi:serine/threonine protein kinase
MSKQSLIDQKQTEHVKNEKSIMLSLQHPYFVRTWAFEQDSRCVYFVQDFVPGGEFNTLLRRCNRFEPPTAAFYAA